MKSRFAFALILCTDISAQVPASSVLVLHGNASNGTTISVYDAVVNRTAKYELSIPDVHAIECSAAGDALLAASVANGGTSVYLVPLGSGGLGTPQSLCSGLIGAPKDLLALDDGKLVVLTENRIYRLAAGYSNCTLLATLADDSSHYADASLTPTGFAVLSVTNGTARIQRFDSSGAVTSTFNYPSIALPSSLAAIGAEFLVATANSNGQLHTTVGATSQLAEDPPPAGQPVGLVRRDLSHLHLVSSNVFTARSSGPQSLPITVNVGGQILDLTPTPAAMFATAGIGCAGTTSSPPVIAGRGRADTLALTVTLSHALPGSIAWLQIGTEAVVGGVPLSPGNCLTLTDAVTTLPSVVAADGTASHTLALPAVAPAIHVQWLVLDTNAQSCIAASAAGRTTL